MLQGEREVTVQTTQPWNNYTWKEPLESTYSNPPLKAGPTSK